ncbi:uncharacterized protein AMSG_01475 [Thecamonas trahens ATCC 50062]|uniref:Uncharacterized protein n=1 Tax=Thecamonas trahens ATCC 50062 TaxID=461836 RepID=A0A0L0DRJ7_THETB|nr:hypothetical protein AMSG_01475 [Thecamonas trahens ATCC 50062]KNC54621.1 hypothetical protein AMSG_01475 [Thecamonas trahens ATCC 50062]|eukprot:XP_013761528.1 hypothetical protein AMSG_01475 [Thecamonas trahens ATCC 50062]
MLARLRRVGGTPDAGPEEAMVVHSMVGYVRRSTGAECHSAIAAARSVMPSTAASPQAGSSAERFGALAHLILAGLHIGENPVEVRRHVSLGWAAIDVAFVKDGKPTRIMDRATAASDMGALIRAFAALDGLNTIGLQLMELGPGDAHMARCLFGCTFIPSFGTWSPMPPLWWTAFQTVYFPIVEKYIGSAAFLDNLSPLAVPLGRKLQAIMSSGLAAPCSDGDADIVRALHNAVPGMTLALDLLNADLGSNSPLEALACGVPTATEAGFLSCILDHIAVAESPWAPTRVDEAVAMVNSLDNDIVFLSSFVSLFAIGASIVALSSAIVSHSVLTGIQTMLSRIPHDPLASVVTRLVEDACRKAAAPNTTEDPALSGMTTSSFVESENLLLAPHDDGSSAPADQLHLEPVVDINPAEEAGSVDNLLAMLRLEAMQDDDFLLQIPQS